MELLYTEINIRDFRVGDEDELWPLISELTDVYPGLWHHTNNDYHCLVVHLTKDKNVQYDNREVYFPAGSIIGFGSIFMMRKIFHHKPIGQIEDVIVHPHFRDNKIGKLIVTSLLVRARMCNCRKVVLNCDEFNEEFYAKLGFRKAQSQMRLD